MIRPIRTAAEEREDSGEDIRRAAESSRRRAFHHSRVRLPRRSPRTALNAARRYASIAPDSPHALHMPSHIFSRVGQWQDSIDTNVRSHAASTQDRDVYHAMDYMVYASLQLARDSQAGKWVDLSIWRRSRMKRRARSPTQAPRSLRATRSNAVTGLLPRSSRCIRRASSSTGLRSPKERR